MPEIASASSRDVSDDVAQRPVVPEKMEPRFVSKERQLEKLRSRLDQEQLRCKRAGV